MPYETNEIHPDDVSSSANAAEAIDEDLLRLLALLWEAAQATPQRPWSLAKLSKRSGVYMSSLLRQLNVLTAAGLVQIVERDVATSMTATVGCGELTCTGRELCTVIFQIP